MQVSWRLALSTLAARKGRSALMVGAVMLAASLIVAVSSTVRSAQASLEQRLVGILGGADARIIHQFNGRLDETLLDEVRAWSEVAEVSGRFVATLSVAPVEGGTDPETGRPLRVDARAIGVEVERAGAIEEVPVAAGSRPRSPDEIMIDPVMAERLGVGVGDELRVVREGEPLTLRVCGIEDRPRALSLRGVVRLDRRTLADALDRSGRLTALLIKVRDGTDVPTFCAAREGALPPALVLEPAEMSLAGFNRRVRVSRLGFVVSSVLAFMCASFIIVTGMTTGISERQRELAMIRCIGGSRGQLFVQQLAIGLIIGGIGSVLGVPLGIALAALLVAHFRDLLPAGFHVLPLGLVLAVAGSVLAGLLGALFPGWAASRVAPMRALTAQGRPPRRRSIVIAAIAAIIMIAGQVLLMAIPDNDTRFWAYVYAGLPLIFLAYFILAVPILQVCTGVIAGPLAAVLRLPPGMLAQSVRTTPFRQGFTAGALMVGVAILVSTWAQAETLLDDWIGRLRFPEGIAFRPLGIDDEERAAIEAVPAVAATCAVSYMHVQLEERVFGVEGVDSSAVMCIGIDTEQFFSMVSIEWAEGDPQRAIEKLASGEGVVVADRFLTTGRAKVGDTITLGATRVRRPFEIVGAIETAGLDIITQMLGIRNAYFEYSIGALFLDLDVVGTVFDHRDPSVLLVALNDDVDDEAAARQIEAALPGIIFRSAGRFRQTIDEVAAALLTVNTTIAFAALVLACIGVGNIILANIQARRFEFGVVRAVGGSRSVLLRVIVGEAVLVACAAAVTGTLLGLHTAACETDLYRALAGLPLGLAIPVIPILAGSAVVVALAMLAALPGAIGVMRPVPSRLLAMGR